MHNPDLIILMIITISFIAGASSSSLLTNNNKTCLWIKFKFFWDIRKRGWLGTDIGLVEDILTDPGFLEGIE